MKIPKNPVYPKLKAMVKELEPIFKKYDTMGLVMLQSEQHAEFRFFFDTSWSIIEDKGEGQVTLKFRKVRHAAGEFTTGAILSLKHLCAMWFGNFDTLEQSIKQHMVVEHEQSPIEPHREPYQ